LVAVFRKSCKFSRQKNDRHRGARAGVVSSVCTGSLILGAAGLLAGYRATSHWLTVEHLARFGAIPTQGRVVRDRNRVTGGGVTAGIDFGLTLLSELRDPAYAQATQLVAEYAPAPPFNTGTPETAPPELVARLRAMGHAVRTVGPYAIGSIQAVLQSQYGTRLAGSDPRRMGYAVGY
jgi:transcriptional regulator GlxA family with amidase domain